MLHASIFRVAKVWRRPEDRLTKFTIEFADVKNLGYKNFKKENSKQ
jgi:hypothetical protein